MAKLTALPSEVTRPTSSLILISLIAFFSGIAIHIQAVRKGPGSLVPSISKLTNEEVIRLLPDDFNATWKLAPNLTNRLLVFLIVFFQSIVSDPTAFGLLLIILSASAPLLSFMSVESLKAGRSKLHHPLVFIAVALISQLVCVGAALPALWVPIYAYIRWSESSTNPPAIHPAPSPSPAHVNLVFICSILAGILSLAQCFVDPTSSFFVYLDIAFQLFPLAYLPLALAGRPSVQKDLPRLKAADLYRDLGFGLALAWWVGLWYAYPGLKKAWKTGVFEQDGAHLLFWDTVGVLIAQYTQILVDSYADEARVAVTGERVMHRRFIVEDIFGLAGLTLLGPGLANATYFRRRESLAEKARVGVKEE
ncbi:hypothetical protein IE81DRAFT_340895 [Ceraceosorus guamensis]|uniref:Uncharacterized protein n=1 Tax=Ceraceosorus guamensis TaxID=1522189 RepID=A0A316W0Y6_9BASI|nr:hypothetical protein IE81DRAFT_340895 [Ceraceosorus guamensis]PWN43164.1 hypothetical protein IE81DRAFT_340895 [Ceraceosorus guamensis]